MGVSAWSAWLIVVTALSTTASTVTFAATCKYSPENRFMDCRRVSPTFLQVGEYPLNITSVQELSLWNTGLSELKENVFTNLTDLEILHLGSNLILNLHHSLFSTLSQLHSLDLSYNRIASLTDNRLFASQTNLVYLHLEGNQLESLDYRVFANLIELTFIDLSNNRLVSLPDKRIFASQGKLEVLVLNNNRLTTLKLGVVKPLYSLNELHLSGNPLKCSCQLYDMLQWCEQGEVCVAFACYIPGGFTLTPCGPIKEGKSCDTHIQSNPTTDISAKSTLPPRVTTNINIYTRFLLQYTTDSNTVDNSEKNYSEMTLSSFSCIYTTTYGEIIDCNNSDLGGLSAGKYPLNITTLDTLNLHNTGLTALEPHIFNQLRRLSVLCLGCNKLQDLDYRLFENLTELCVLDLSYNLLVSLSPGTRMFRSQGKLKTLLLNNNQLTYLDEGLLKPLHSLRELYLSGNPFTCDCRLHATVLLCERRNIYTNATCNRPLEFRGSAWQILKENGSCDGHEQYEAPRDVALPIVVVCLVLFCGFCALFGLCCWWRRRGSSSGHQGRRMYEYDDVGLTGLCDNVSSHAQVPGYASILSELPNSATNEFPCNVTSSRSNISSHAYDYVRNLEAENVSPRSQCPKNTLASGVTSIRNNIPSHAYDDVGNQISEDGSYILPNSA